MIYWIQRVQCTVCVIYLKHFYRNAELIFPSYHSHALHHRVNETYGQIWTSLLHIFRRNIVICHVYLNRLARLTHYYKENMVACWVVARFQLFRVGDHTSHRISCRSSTKLCFLSFNGIKPSEF